MMRLRTILVVCVLAVGAAAGAYYWWQQQNNQLPAHIATGNGRIEAEEVHVAAKYAGRVSEVLAREGDMVDAGDVLARMDTAELDASFARAKADIAQAQEAVAEARAQIAQRESELSFAEQELGRAIFLVQKGHVSKEHLERRQTERDTARAVLDAAGARLFSTQRAVESAAAEARRIEAQIDDSVLKAPREGRIQYRLAEPGEVLADGGKVVTLLDLSDVYMTIFLPTSQVGRVFVGSQARIILDAVPEFVIPAKVSFVAANAQFTPREVETRSEREKLMFRVKVKIDPALLRAHVEKVKTGLPGEAYVLLGSDVDWPAHLGVRLPPAPGQ
ncbi:HlyD family efflux transporter periplasmic adaptor subunit [Pelagibius litoralis]|uniref:HlyD family efflux transporter periplasmic adaptor subunit n=1 Tax=Pelagibius litoralis TaxID=374515 RepID=A0A967CB23_9PROT|nr:HlyD family efflux transporter periplasmic adaptor subunit [Pelagibius litoralis]NIA67859.1 HlyD family efflux transporter periplasmic adaptor subunit [Pelagibius litoralis]